MTCFVPPTSHNSQSLSLALESDCHLSRVEVESLNYIFKKLTKDTKAVVNDWGIIKKG